ncbi:MAG: hypothetical protein LUD72_00945 [Bacteroidales bacterium]|nr:hypothetical protein [Bacteroidales bacterium]
MKTFTLYRLYDGDDEIVELGWHICKTYAEWAKSLYPNPSYEVEIREIPVVIDTERNAFFLYSYDGEYVSRQELVTLIGEGKVKRYEDLKFDPDHERPISHCEIDKHYDGGECDGNVYGVEMLHVGMEEIAPEPQDVTTKPSEETKFFAVNPNTSRSHEITNEEANNMFGTFAVDSALRCIHDHKKMYPNASQPSTLLVDHPATDGSLLMVQVTYENYKENDPFSFRFGFKDIKTTGRPLADELLYALGDSYKPIGLLDGLGDGLGEDLIKAVKSDYVIVSREEVRNIVNGVCAALDPQSGLNK